MSLVLAVGGALLIVPTLALGTVLELGPFNVTTITTPVGVAVAPSNLLATHPACGNTQVVSISPTGAVSVFATLARSSEDCREPYLAIAPTQANPTDFLNTPVVSTPNGSFTPNEAGFASTFVYVTQGAKIIKIVPDGSSHSTFATIPTTGEGTPCGANSPPGGNGITFDENGSFGHQLMIVCANGPVWLLNKNGATVGVDGSPRGTPIFDLSAVTEACGPFEGPAVAPSSFSPYGGRLLVAAENAFCEGPSGQVWAVTPDGTTSNAIGPIRAAEGVAFVPSRLCNFGASGGTFFTAVFGNDSIFKLPKSAFTSLIGSAFALVPSEAGVTGESPSEGLTLLTSSGGTVTKSRFSDFFANHQGAAFCDDNVPINLTGFIEREPQVINDPTDHGVITAFFLTIPGKFDPSTIICDADHLRAGRTGIEKSFAFCTPNLVQRHGGPAREVKFFKDKLGLTGPLRGPFLRFKFTDVGGPTGGSDGCGGG